MNVLAINDLYLEGIRAFVLVALLIILFYRGRLTPLAKHPGWKQIQIGFALIAIATILDITDEISGLEKFIIIGDTEIASFLEKVPGYLLGFIMVMIGFYKIIPSLIKAQRVERELEHYRENLENLVKERTQQLVEAQAELLQKERLATLGQLTASVSHELRNPLGTIKSALFLIEENLNSTNPQNTSRPLELAERSINRCVKIIEELTNYARVKDLELSSQSVSEWLRKVIEEQNISRAIKVELDLEQDFRAQFDEGKLWQVIVNIINNSIHALESKASTRKVLNISANDLGKIYEIKIQDNGVGISRDVIDRIFEPLFSTKDFGVGLGMVIVKNLIQQHNGSIQVESKDGKGTTITLRLPKNIDKNGLQIDTV